MPLIKNTPAFAKCDTCSAKSPPCTDVLKAEREAEAQGWWISPMTEEVVCPACWERRVRGWKERSVRDEKMYPEIREAEARVSHPCQVVLSQPADERA